MMNELTSEQEDFILEEGMDKYYEKKYRDSFKNSQIKHSKPLNLKDFKKDEVNLNYSHKCAFCGCIYEENDLDRHNGNWICRECERQVEEDGL